MYNFRYYSIDYVAVIPTPRPDSPSSSLSLLYLLAIEHHGPLGTLTPVSVKASAKASVKVEANGQSYR
jgi:hypothetical protein